jgi:hypothetical protein
MSDTEPARASHLQRLANRRFWTSVSAVLGGLAAATGILAFGLSFVGGSESAGCEERTAAALGNPTVHPTKLEDFLRRFSSSEDGDPVEGYTDEQLGTDVQYVSVDISLDGQKGKPITLRWSMEDASNPGAGGLPQNLNAAEITPPTCEHSHREHVLLDPAVPPGRLVVVRLFLQDEEGNELGAEKRTKPIRSVG